MTNRTTRRRPLLLACLAVALTAGALLGCPSPAQACPNCRELIAQNSPNGRGPNPGGLARGFNYSIYLMLAMPFLLMGSFGAGVWYVATHPQAGAVGSGTTVPGAAAPGAGGGKDGPAAPDGTNPAA